MHVQSPSSGPRARRSSRWILVLSGIVALLAGVAQAGASTGGTREVMVRWLYRFDASALAGDSRFLLEAIPLSDGADAAPVAVWEIAPEEGDFVSERVRSLSVAHRVAVAGDAVGYRLSFRQGGETRVLGATMRSEDPLAHGFPGDASSREVSLLSIVVPDSWPAPVDPALAPGSDRTSPGLGAIGFPPAPQPALVPFEPFVAPGATTRSFDAVGGSCLPPVRDVTHPPPRGEAA